MNLFPSIKVLFIAGLALLGLDTTCMVESGYEA